jgi:hypothetical protein
MNLAGARTPVAAVRAIERWQSLPCALPNLAIGDTLAARPAPGRWVRRRLTLEARVRGRIDLAITE